MQPVLLPMRVRSAYPESAKTLVKPRNVRPIIGIEGALSEAAT